MLGSYCLTRNQNSDDNQEGFVPTEELNLLITLIDEES